MNKIAKRNWINISLIVLFASLLTLTMYFTFIQNSGAWFTASDEYEGSSVSLRFGTITLQDNIKLGDYDTNQYVERASISNIVPTQTIEYFGSASQQNISYTGNVDAYYRITFSITNLKNSDDTAIDPEEDDMTVSSMTSKFAFANGSSVLYGRIAVDTASYIEKGYLVFSSTANNDYTDYKFTIQVKIDLVQAVNLESIIGSTSSGITASQYETLFAAYDSWSA